MKLKKMPPPENVLDDFIEAALPDTLELQRVGHGYGYITTIVPKDTKRSFMDKVCERVSKDAIAIIHTQSVELLHPQWLADMQDILQAYDRKYSTDTTLAYWEEI